MGLRSSIAKKISLFLPVGVQRFIGNLYGYIKSPSKSYSLYGEDLVVFHFFHNVGVKNGVYVDIGAFHPKWISNTHLLSKNKWKGIVVDLEEEKLKLFRFFRNDCKALCAAVVPDNNIESVEYYSFNRLLSEWDTISHSEAEMRREKSNVNYIKKSVSALTINKVMSDAQKFTGHSVDYLNIDIEGMDEK